MIFYNALSIGNELAANTVDAAFEKHIPVFEVNAETVTVKIGSVEHKQVGTGKSFENTISIDDVSDYLILECVLITKRAWHKYQHMFDDSYTTNFAQVLPPIEDVYCFPRLTKLSPLVNLRYTNEAIIYEKKKETRCLLSNCISSINHVFTKKVLNDFLDKGTSSIYEYAVKKFTTPSDGKTNGELIKEIYSCLGKQHRNEYYYTNTLLNKLLIGIHNVNTATALAQLRIADHIADFVLINGEGRVYEIKSELDNLERLNGQISDYYKAFSKVSVLVSGHEHDHVKDTLSKLGSKGNSVGIYVLSDKDRIFSRTISREPKTWNESLEYKHLFALLRKKEYESIIQEYFGEKPNVASVFYYRTCLAMFSEIPILDAQKLVCSKLKQRNTISKTELQSVPEELRSLVYFSNMSNRIAQLNTFLKQAYQGR